MLKKTGGFFALDLPLPAAPHNLLSLWSMGGEPACFTNARSALNHLLHPTEFPVEHTLAAHMLTLPIDHRYGPADMQRIAQCGRRLLP